MGIQPDTPSNNTGKTAPLRTLRHRGSAENNRESASTKTNQNLRSGHVTSVRRPHLTFRTKNSPACLCDNGGLLRTRYRREVASFKRCFRGNTNL